LPGRSILITREDTTSMPDLGVFHPQIVHFVVALGLVGALLRLVSLTGRLAWTNDAAAALLIIAAGASVAAVESGTDAHDAAERVPGAREAVMTHEEWGKRTRNVLLGVAGLEILGLIFARTGAGKAIRLLSAAGGIAAGACIVIVGDLGGDVVYEYAGGVGTRSGDPADIHHLLVAGLFYSARLARDSGKADDAARFIDELARRLPGDTTVRFLAIESRIRDRHDAEGALADLAAFRVPADNPRLAVRHGLLSAEALSGSGRADSARRLLRSLAARFPESRGVRDALARLR
jgi:uncharacterized membrane protein